NLGPLYTLNLQPFVEAQNPYVVGPPVEGEVFVGRNDVLKMIKDNLAPAAGKNILVLRGQRRTGKTSVLWRVRDTLVRDSDGVYLPVLVDLQGMQGIKSEDQFFYILAYRIWSALKTYEVNIPEPLEADFEKGPTIAFELHFLEEVTRALGQRRILLMFDE